MLLHLNKNSKIFSDNNKRNLQRILDTQRVVRNLDQIHIIDKNKNLIMSSSNSPYVEIEDRALKMVLNDDRPLKIVNAFENKSSAIIKLSTVPNTFLYVVKFLEDEIMKSSEAQTIIQGKKYEGEIKELFKKYLDRWDVKPEELNFYSQQIVNGKSIKIVEDGIKNSDESKKLPYWQDD